MFDLIGGRWTSVVLYAIGNGVRRSSDLRRHILSVSKKMLTQMLRNLERDGLVTRDVYAVVTPETAYPLTEQGLLILALLSALSDWPKGNEDDWKAIYGRRKKKTGHPDDAWQEPLFGMCWQRLPESIG